MRFEIVHTDYLFFLFLIPLFILLYFFTSGIRKKRALKFANFEAISRVTGIDFISKNPLPLVFHCILIFFIVLYASKVNVYTEGEISDFSFIIAIDSSSSMATSDVLPTRLDYAKNIAKEIVNELPEETKIGVVSFGAYSFIETEIIKDKLKVKKAIENVAPRGIGGTGFYESIITSANLLSEEEGKVMIILSDGQINLPDLENAINYAMKKGIKVYTIPIGTEEGGKFLEGVSKLNKEPLKAISYQTNGEMIEGNSTEEIIQNLKKSISIRKGIIKKDISSYALYLFFLLFTIEFIIVNIK
ncbi:MAG: VWA domain-containing protein [Candidatus Pacearchaeota archaeon]